MATTEFGRREQYRGRRAARALGDEPPAEPGADSRPGQAGRSGARGRTGSAGAGEVDPQSAARTICLRLLDRRARTRTELAEALAAREIPDDAATAVLDRFTEVGLIDDAQLADRYAEAQHSERGLAARAVAQKLRQRGVADEQIDAALGDIDRDRERATAEQLVAWRLRSLTGLDPQVQTRRLVGLLARKGYAPGLAYEVVRDAVRGAAGVAGAPADGEAPLDLSEFDSD